MGPDCDLFQFVRVVLVGVGAIESPLPTLIPHESQSPVCQYCNRILLHRRVGDGRGRVPRPQVSISGSWTPSENALAKFDDELGWSYLPNHAASQEFGTDSHPIDMQFDERGIRVADRETPLDPAAPSALFVGGSFTMGHGLEFEDTFIGQLDAMPGFPLQVVNLGVQGFGTDQSLLQLKRHIETFDTKLVVYTFMHDHVRRNANHDRRILFPKGRFLGTKPMFQLGDDGRPVQNRKPMRFEDTTFIRLWGTVQGAWAHWGPEPTPAVTRALVQEMKQVAEGCDAQLIVIDWNQDEPGISRPSILDDLDLHLIDTAADSPDGWHTWKIPGDTHPDQQASGYAAQLIYDKLTSIGLIENRQE
jgi:hypothetical protein